MAISPVDEFSFLLEVKDVIIDPSVDVCLKTGAELAVTSICIVCVSVSPKLSATWTNTGCASVPSPLLVVLNASVDEETFNVSTPAVDNLTKSAV